MKSHGFWQNHSSAWCMETIQLGCETYTVSEAIAIMRHNSQDKTYLLAQELIAAKLNIACREANSSCIADAIVAADAWLCDHPIGSGVTGGSVWNQIRGTHTQLERYNTGNLCAPSCDDDASLRRIQLQQ